MQPLNPMMRRHLAYALILAFFPIAPVVALPDDQKKALELSANSADLNQQDKHGEYYGQVVLDQGTTHLRAVKAITNTDKDNQLTEAIAFGDPSLPENDPNRLVHYWTQPSLDKPELHAYADVIHYYPKQHRIELLGHAHVVQGEDSLTAEKIFYNTETQHVITAGNKTNRTVIVFHPGSPNPQGQTSEKNASAENPSSANRAPSPRSQGEGKSKEVL